MMTKSKKFLLLMLTLMVSVVGYAQTEIDGLFYNLNEETKEAEVTEATPERYSGDVVIPSIVTCEGTEYKVTGIGQYGFYDCVNLKSVTIPNSVTSIGESAFCGCFSLNSVTMSNSIKSIGNRAFYNNRLTSISIPKTVTSIGEYAFSCCDELTSITIPNSVTSIGQGAFSGCISLTSITISNSVTSIEPYTFNCAKSLTSITIPNSVTSIGFAAFANCYALTSITIPNSVTNIEGSAFSSCKSLISVTFPNSVTSIGENLFSGCKSLTSITIPSSVTSIGKGVFDDFNSQVSVTNFSKVPQKIEQDWQFGSGIILHVLPGCKAAYRAADFWKNFRIVEDAVLPDDKYVTDLINSIGIVELTETSKAKIDAARSAYNLLTKEQQVLVKNLSILVEAEKTYKQFETTGIANVETKNENKDGKFLENGKIVIVRNGKKYNLNGQAE